MVLLILLEDCSLLKSADNVLLSGKDVHCCSIEVVVE